MKTKVNLLLFFLSSNLTVLSSDFSNIWDVVNNCISLKECKDGVRKFAKDLNAKRLIAAKLDENRPGDISVFTKNGPVLVTSLDKSCPIHMAACMGNSNAIQALVEAGAEVDSLDNADNTPLHYAAKYGHPSTVKMLRSLGGNPSLENKDYERPVDCLKEIDTRFLALDMKDLFR